MSSDFSFLIIHTQPWSRDKNFVKFWTVTWLAHGDLTNQNEIISFMGKFKVGTWNWPKNWASAANIL